ncbi:uncharacterized protein LOC144430437 [Styela clava]
MRRIHRVQYKKGVSKNSRSKKPAFTLANPHETGSTIRNITKPRYRVEIIVAERRIKGFANTGADINVMSKSSASKLKLPLCKTKIKLRPYGSKPIRCAGYYEGSIMFKNAATTARFYIVPGDSETLLSGQLCEELGIIKFNNCTKECSGKLRAVRKLHSSDSDIFAKYPEVFMGVGTLIDHEVHFYMNNKIPPVAQAARPIPFHLRERFQQAIVQMEEQRIIEGSQTRCSHPKTMVISE